MGTTQGAASNTSRPVQRHSSVPMILVIIGLVALLCAGYAIAWTSKTSTSAPEVTTYATHDIGSIASFRSEYVGDNSNTVNLLSALPLGHAIDMVQIAGTDVDILTDLTLAEITDRADLLANVLYSAMAFMASVDNATSVNYSVGDEQFYVERTALEERFGEPLARHLEEDDWQDVRAIIPLEAGTLVHSDGP